MKGRLVLHAAIALGAALLLASFHHNVSRKTQYTENPWGCDWFGYLRQAQLFRERGLLDGLETKLPDAGTRYLTETGKRTGVPFFPAWEGVAPYCHHYKPVTDAVILQYPPGTGLLMSFFPAGIQARSMFVGLNVVLLMVMGSVLLQARTVFTAVFASLAGLAVLYDISLFVLDWSVLPSCTVSLLAAACAARLARAESSADRAGWAATLGLAAGCTVDMRLINALIAAGPMIVLAAAFVRQPSRSTASTLLFFGVGLFVGMLPVLVFNAINAGRPWLTTYNEADSTLPILTWDVLWTGIRFYLVQREPTGVLNPIVIVIVAVSICVERVRDGKVSEATLAAAISYGVTFVYLITHPLRVLYYIAPACVFAAATPVFFRLASENARAAARSMRSLTLLVRASVVVAMLVTAGLTIKSVSMPRSPEFEHPGSLSSIEPNAIVWADLSGGYFYYFHRRQAARPHFLEAALHDRFVAEIDRDGVPQYLVLDNDSDRMRAVRDRLAQTHRLRKVAPVFGFETYRIELR